MAKGTIGTIEKDEGTIEKCDSLCGFWRFGQSSRSSPQFTINNIYWIGGTRDDRSRNADFWKGRHGTIEDDLKNPHWNSKVFFWLVFNIFMLMLCLLIPKKTFEFQWPSNSRRIDAQVGRNGRRSIFAPPASVFYRFHMIDYTSTLKKLDKWSVFFSIYRPDFLLNVSYPPFLGRFSAKSCFPGFQFFTTCLCVFT